MVKQDMRKDEYFSPADNQQGTARWLLGEAKFHLLPWSGNFMTQKPAMVAAGIGFAVFVSVTWILAATGQIRPAAVIGWWTAWSVYEFMCRMRCKPWIKEGPWWKKDYRKASAPDLIAYVVTKNLLIGVGLFLILYSFGVLP